MLQSIYQQVDITNVIEMVWNALYILLIIFE
jgi:hypothetical protein